MQITINLDDALYEHLNALVLKPFDGLAGYYEEILAQNNLSLAQRAPTPELLKKLANQEAAQAKLQEQQQAVEEARRKALDTMRPKVTVEK